MGGVLGTEDGVGWSGGGALVVLPLPAWPLASGAGVCQALRTPAPGQSASEPGPPGSASSGGTFATRAPAHRHTRPRFHE